MLSVKHPCLSSVTDHFPRSSVRSDVLVPLLAGGHKVLMRFPSEVSDLGDPFCRPSVGQVTGEASGVHLELTWSSPGVAFHFTSVLNPLVKT